jgi:hypothetical protein
MLSTLLPNFHDAHVLLMRRKDRIKEREKGINERKIEVTTESKMIVLYFLTVRS